MNKTPFTRYLEGTRLFYDVLSSKGMYYYTVEMLGQVAISCECRAGQFQQSCKHKKTAEKAEREFQNSLVKPVINPVEVERVLPPLNGTREFSLLKK